MKMLLLSGLLFVAIQQNYAQTTHILFSEESLQGNVKVLTEMRYTQLKKGNNANTVDSLSKQIYEFDKAGNNTAQILYHPVKDANDEKFLIAYKSYTYSSSKNGQGNNQIETFGSYVTSVSEFDDKGILNIINYFDKKGKPIAKAIFQHNNHNRQTEYSLLNEKGVPDFRWTYQYDDKDHLIKIEGYDKKGIYSFKRTFEYLKFDDAGNWTLCRHQYIKKNKTTENSIERQYVYYK